MSNMQKHMQDKNKQWWFSELLSKVQRRHQENKRNRNDTEIIITILVTLTLVFPIFIGLDFNNKRLHEIVQLQSQTIEEQKETIRVKTETILKQQDKIEELKSAVQDLNKYNIDLFEITAYSPHDDKNGLSSDGSPDTTATGTYPTTNRTIAVDPRVIPYGTKVWINGYGWRVAEDTGGMIKGNKIDIVVDTFDEAMQIGRKEHVVVFELEE